MNNMPNGYAFHGEPHVYTHEDCNGNVSPECYRQFVMTPNKKILIGCGVNPNDAKINAILKAEKHHLFKSQDNMTQIKTLLKKDNLCWNDLTEALPLIVDVLSEIVDSKENVNYPNTPEYKGLTPEQVNETLRFEGHI